MASIKDVARMAGVSVSTVSRVLSGAPNVDPARRARVEAAVARIRYRPNLLAQGLRSGSGALIGLAVPVIVHETFASFIEHTEGAARELGYSLIVGNTRSEPEAERAFIDGLVRRHVDGVIFSRVSDRSDALAMLQRTNTPVVVLDRALDREDVPAVVLDNPRAGELAAEHLLGLGHRHIAVITGPRDLALSRERLRGFKAALARRGVPLPATHVLEGDFKFASGIAAARELLDRGLDVTAVWAQNDLMAVGVLAALTRAGVRVPGDVSLVGMDDSSSAGIIVPALTTVSQPFGEMARRAVELVVAARGGAPAARRRVVLPPGLVVRESSAPPAGAARGGKNTGGRKAARAASSAVRQARTREVT